MEKETRPNEYEEANDRITNMTSLAECLEHLQEKGFTEQFRIEGLELHSSGTDNKVYRPADVKAVNFFRFEGISDPDDTAILYALETNDGKKGTLVDAYGAYADPDVDEFVKTMEIHKKVN